MSLLVSDRPSVSPPFGDFAATLPRRTALREAIMRHERAPEAECVAVLRETAALPPDLAAQANGMALSLIRRLRAKGTHGPVAQLMREYGLSSAEGVALMGLAEALLRIPDRQTRDLLIRDTLASGRWGRHFGASRPLLVNAATGGLALAAAVARGDRQKADGGTAGLAPRLTPKLAPRLARPALRHALDRAMRMMGGHFVAGETIASALRDARPLEAKGFRHSYDMLGEAAVTAADAERYDAAYTAAIHAIGCASAAQGPYEGPGISIKLSALHPRYTRAQRQRVMDELLPRLRKLAVLARGYDIGLNIDAEESDRLDLSLDLLEALCLDPALAGWAGLGFVVQAYQKRAPFVLDWIIDLGRRSGHRLMVRLVKGAYWDSEIKRAQQDGLADFPVFTRKAHTDLSYIACARKLLAAPDAIFPQFATHNAQTLGSVLALAGPDFAPGSYEFQCLHGMGEALYEEMVGAVASSRPCRIYAPVGSHETLLPYLVRRLLENGANGSFVNRIQDASIDPEALARDPAAEAGVGQPHPAIVAPRDLYGARANARGIDLASEPALAALAEALLADAADGAQAGDAHARPVRNPARHDDVVGRVAEADDAQVDAALDADGSGWRDRTAGERAACLRRAADLLEQRMPVLLGLIVREAGKSFANAVAELREAVDFLRYYADAAERLAALGETVPLGRVVCISPWNFPLAIFTGQVAAALVVGNSVLAKPAEETPLVAAQAVAILHEAGVPEGALQLLIGAGEVGARLVADPRCNGVLFTGSTEVARLIQRSLADRLNPDGAPVPLVAETGGQNAMVVDSSALPEQVVADVLASAFDSAGQRCSALRVLCVQDDIADRLLAMLRAALAELRIGDPGRLETDIGPVISKAARDGIEAHLTEMRASGHRVHRPARPPEGAQGWFVAPAIVEMDGLSMPPREVFGPVLHVLRYRHGTLDAVMAAVEATGYGLTFGVHSRVASTIAGLSARAAAGNVYVNRNVIGAVVGVQPFGGHGLSGTGPKAGGPLYLRRLLARRPSLTGLPRGRVPEAVEQRSRVWSAWLTGIGQDAAARSGAAALAATPLGVMLELPGPVGERNVYSIEPRGRVLCLAAERPALLGQIGMALATGNRAVVRLDALRALVAEAGVMPPSLADWIVPVAAVEHAPADAILFSGSREALTACTRMAAVRPGAIVPVHVDPADGPPPLEWLVQERSVSTNTAAAGGNASLLTIV